MSQDSPLLIDPNTADAQTLMKIPGVGPALAQQIIANRPFADLEDLQRVSGVGPHLLERIQPYVTLQPRQSDETAHLSALEPEEYSIVESGAAEAEAAVAETRVEGAPATALLDEDSELIARAKAAAPPPAEAEPPASEQPAAEVEAAATPPEVAPSGETAAPTPPETPPAATPAVAPVAKPEAMYITRSQATWAVALGVLVALFLSLIVTLAFLASINEGRLRYATPAQLNALALRVEAVEQRISDLQLEQDGLRARVDNLEALSGRVSALEKESRLLRAEMDAANSELKQLSGHVDEVSKQIVELGEQFDELQAQTDRFAKFFKDLRELLDNLFPQEDNP